MNKWRDKLTGKRIFLFGAGILCLLLFGIITLTEKTIQNGLYDQQLAARWSENKDVSQVSAFFAAGEVDGPDYFTGIGMTLDKKLTEASLTAPNEQARLRIDAISIPGKVTLSNGSRSTELTAFGVEGDFFQFHPLMLLEGSFFDLNSMMQDGIIIDEETAWQLFGSSDVAGMQVMLGQVPHYISGVVRRDSGRIAEAAGLDKSVCYLSIDSLLKYGMVNGGYCYEVLMPNPVKGFARTALSEALEAEKKQVHLVENSTRFQSLSLLEIIVGFGTRSMSKQQIIYPYWENMARGYEDIFALILILKAVLLIYPSLFGGISLILFWKKRHRPLREKVFRLREKLYDYSVKLNNRKKEEGRKK